MLGNIKSTMKIVLTLSIIVVTNVCWGQSKIYYTEKCEITIKELMSFYRLGEIDSSAATFTNTAQEYDPDDNLIRTINYKSGGQVDSVIYYDNSGGRDLTLLRSNRWVPIGIDKKKYPKKRLKEVYTHLDYCLSKQSSFKTSKFIRINDYPELINLLQPKSNYDPHKTSFQIVEEAPYFPGGLATLGEFLSLYLQYPESARSQNVTGVVKVQFTINKNGSTSDFNIIQGLGYGCDKEAIRALKRLPDWVPGYQRGVPVKTTMILPITFN